MYYILITSTKMNTAVVQLKETSNKIGETIGKYWYAFAAVFVVLLIIVIYLGVKRNEQPAEGFNPTQTMKRQEQDQVNVGSSIGGELLSQPMGFVPNTSSDPSTAGYQVLHDPSYDCNNRKLQPDDAWSWQYAVAKGPGESLSNPKTDRDLSKIMNGM